MDTSPHTPGFVTVNGVRLHYLDWGGSGETLLFLAGMGCNAHIFDRFAPRFTGHFRVLGLTRRGHGESDHPESGYDIDTLVEDLRQFLGAMGLERVILAGHSLAGIELSQFAALYPTRVSKLVYLDAAYYRSSPTMKTMREKNPLGRYQPAGLDAAFYSFEDYQAALYAAYPSLGLIWADWMEEQARQETQVLPDGRVVDRMSDAIGQALSATLYGYQHQDWNIQAPVLGVYARFDGRDYLNPARMTQQQMDEILAFYENEYPPLFEANLAEFRQHVPHARVVVIPHGHHYCFIRQEELVFTEMRKFLLEQEQPWSIES